MCIPSLFQVTKLLLKWKKYTKSKLLVVIYNYNSNFGSYRPLKNHYWCSTSPNFYIKIHISSLKTTPLLENFLLMGIYHEQYSSFVNLQPTCVYCWS